MSVGLDLSPRPGAASATRMLRAQTAMELRLLLRNGEQLLLTLFIPMLLLVMGTRSDKVVDLGAGRPIDIVTPGVLALAVMSTSFTSLAIATGFEGATVHSSGSAPHLCPARPSCSERSAPCWRWRSCS